MKSEIRMSKSEPPKLSGEINQKETVRRIAVGLASIAILFLVSVGKVDAASAQSGPTWKAGVAKAIITPEKPIWLAGYAVKRVPDGKLHDLWMKALTLEDASGHRAVLITSDFQGIPKGMSDPAFEELRKQYNLERKDV